jgi:hypothetical protein
MIEERLYITYDIASLKQRLGARRLVGGGPLLRHRRA